jgi:hypothetical protein
MSDSNPPPPPPAGPSGESAARQCPWCSAALPPGDVARCPSCDAQLVGDDRSSVPGVTAIDAEAILRARSAVGRSRPRGRLLSWISGEGDDPPPKPAEGSLAPPPLEVRREMLRLEMAAAEADLRSQLEAQRIEAEAEGEGEAGRPDAAEPDDPADDPAGDPAAGDR